MRCGKGHARPSGYGEPAQAERIDSYLNRRSAILGNFVPWVPYNEVRNAQLKGPNPMTTPRETEKLNGELEIDYQRNRVKFLFSLSGGCHLIWSFLVCAFLTSFYGTDETKFPENS